MEMIINNYYTDIKREVLEKRKFFLKSQKQSIDLILFGDSILQGFDINRFGGSQKYILNSAIGGDRLDFMLDRMSEDVLDFRPKEVLFLGGINNIRTWYNENKKVDDIDDIVEEVVCLYKQIVDKFLANEITIYPCLIILNAEHKNNYPFLNIVINKVNENLITYFEQYNLQYVDFNKVLVSKYNFLSMDFTDDGLHPNDIGNFEIYKMLRNMKIL